MPGKSKAEKRMAREDTFYAGDDTLAAARYRDVRIRVGMSSGPARWLGTALGLVLGKKVPGMPKQDAGVVDFARGFLNALGYDPDTHSLSRRRDPVKGRGLVVRDRLDKEVQFVKAKQVEAMANDPLSMSGYAEEVEA